MRRLGKNVGRRDENADADRDADDDADSVPQAELGLDGIVMLCPCVHTATLVTCASSLSVSSPATSWYPLAGLRCQSKLGFVMSKFLDSWFGIHQRGSSVRLEILGGATTFATMAYIIVVNPAILAAAGIDVAASTIATILAAVFGCLLMGFYANRPIAVAPYMGENAFIAFGLATTITWQQRLGSVFIAGIVFLILTLLGARTWLASAVSPNLKHSFAIGIGMFLLLIGMYDTGIVASTAQGTPVAVLADKENPSVLGAPPTPLRIGNFHDLKVQLAIAGFALIAVMMYW